MLLKDSLYPDCHLLYLQIQLRAMHAWRSYCVFGRGVVRGLNLLRGRARWNFHARVPMLRSVLLQAYDVHVESELWPSRNVSLEITNTASTAEKAGFKS